MNPQNPNRGFVGTSLAQLATWVQEAFDFVCAHITAQWEEEHKADGSHGDITADSIALGGDEGDGQFLGNVGASLVPTADGQDLGAVVALPGGQQAQLPWRDLYLSGSIKWMPFAATLALVTGRPQLTRSGNNLTLASDGTFVFSLTNGLNTHTFTIGRGLAGLTTNRALSAGSVSSSVGYQEYGRSALVGDWLTPTFNAGDFTASSGTWTVDSGDVVTYAYTLIGKTMTITWAIQGTDVSAGSVLRLAIPGGFTAAKNTYGVHRASNAGGAEVAALARVLASGTYVELYATMAAGTWTITAGDNTTTQGTLTFEIA